MYRVGGVLKWGLGTGLLPYIIPQVPLTSVSTELWSAKPAGYMLLVALVQRLVFKS